MPIASSFLITPLLAFALCFLLHIAALRLFPYWGLLDFPERYGLIRARIPYPTGILSVATFLLCIPALFPHPRDAIGLVIGILILATFCFMDDRRTLTPWLRIGVQALVAMILFLAGARIYSLTNPLEHVIGGAVIPLDKLTLTLPHFGPLSIIGALFTILWLGLTINALNWFDGIPGQVSTLSTIGFLTIGFLSLSSRVDDPALAQISFVLAGISAASLLFDFPPPRVILGDSGSMFYGLMMGVLTINAGKGKVATAFLVLGVPLIDSIIVSLRRIAQGRSPLRGSQSGEHLHHRLLAKGWKSRTIIFLTASLGTIFGVTALFLTTFTKFVAALILFAMMLGLSWYSRPGKSERSS